MHRFYVLIAVIWSTVLIETWYRREGTLRFKWGMCRYTETEVPRPTFKGQIKVSEYNGDIIEDHDSVVMLFELLIRQHRCSSGHPFIAWSGYACDVYGFSVVL